MFRNVRNIFVLAAFGLAATAHAADTTVQSKELFEAAISNTSTSPSYVFVNIIDEYNGVKKNECVTANLLLGAIHIEYNIGYDKESRNQVKNIAFSARDREFYFKNPKALSNIQPDTVFAIKNSIACKILKRGGSAYLADRSGAVVEGIPFQSESER